MKKNFKISSIVPLTGSFLDGDISDYFNFLRHMVGNQKWFLELIDEQEKIHTDIFKNLNDIKSIDDALIELERYLFNNISKQASHFLKLKSCITIYIARNNASLLFMFKKMSVSRKYTIREMEKVIASGTISYEAYPIPKDELNKLFSEQMKLA